MKITSKFTVAVLAFLSLFLIPCPAMAGLVPFTHAQSAPDEITALDEIKARLEEEGISVIDYSTPEGKWGSITDNRWLTYLKNSEFGAGFSNLKAMAGVLETHFIDLTALRRQLAFAISEKSQKTIQADIDAINEEILKLQGNDEEKGLIQLKEDEIRDEIKIKILGNVSKYNNEFFPEENDPKLIINDDIKNLIFKEVDFYFNYSKWGRLPTRIIEILEGKKYISLQDVTDQWELEEFHPYSLETELSQIEGLSADDARLITDSIAILSATGERQLTEVARSLTDTVKNLIAGLAVLWIIYAGIRMIFAQGDETVITEQKRAILYGVIGLVVILLVGRGIDFLYGPAGVTRTMLEEKDVAGFSAEVYGIVTFLKALIGIVAILFIIISGVRMMFAAGEESEITKQKTSLLWIGVGLILIAVDQIVVKNLFIMPVEQSDQIRTSNITALINTIGSVLQFILGFVGLIAFGVLVYGAATMIANYGNDEMVEKSKKIIKNAIIGILVIISAYTLVATLVIFR